MSGLATERLTRGDQTTLHAIKKTLEDLPLEKKIDSLGKQISIYRESAMKEIWDRGVPARWSADNASEGEWRTRQLQQEEADQGKILGRLNSLYKQLVLEFEVQERKRIARLHAEMEIKSVTREITVLNAELQQYQEFFPTAETEMFRRNKEIQALQEKLAELKKIAEG